jgi:hypothetical protein
MEQENTMSRLLFAAARGARIECYDSYSKEWKEVNAVWLDALPSDRIHPDDEHLAYGPVSSALREFAITGELSNEYRDAMEYCKSRYTELFNLPKAHLEVEGYFKLVRLILAEALADEGL